MVEAPGADSGASSSGEHRTPLLRIASAGIGKKNSRYPSSRDRSSLAENNSRERYPKPLSLEKPPDFFLSSRMGASGL